MVRIGGGSTFVLSDRLIVCTKSRKHLFHRKYLLYETGCSWTMRPSLDSWGKFNPTGYYWGLRKKLSLSSDLFSQLFINFYNNYFMFLLTTHTGGGYIPGFVLVRKEGNKHK